MQMLGGGGVGEGCVCEGSLCGTRGRGVSDL